MQEDNIYPTSYYNAMKQPQEAKKANEEEEKRQATADLPIVEKAVERLKKHRDIFDRMPSIPNEVLDLSDKESTALKVQLAINKGMYALLVPIVEEMEDIVKTYKR